MHDTFKYLETGTVTVNV